MRDVTNRIVNEMVQEIKSMIDTEELTNSDMIDAYIKAGYLFEEQDFRFLLEENMDKGLSSIDACSMVVGEYRSLSSLINDLLNDILIEEIENKLRKENFYYIEE